jgi:DNA-binding NarL/FixJ family response regulator
MLHILIADDHGIVRSGIRMLIDRQEGMRVVAEAEDGAEAVEMVLSHRPDIAVLDVAMPRLTGIQAAREIKAQAPDTNVLLLSMHDDEGYLFDALKAGASGYVLKKAADTDLIEAIRQAASGQSFLSTGAQSTLVSKWLEDGSNERPRDVLTPREQEVVKLIAEAHTNKEIAEILKLSEKTVESHRANVLAKLGMRDRVELVRYAIKKGLIEA